MGLFDIFKKGGKTPEAKNGISIPVGSIPVGPLEASPKKEGGHGDHWHIIAGSGEEIQKIVMDTIAHGSETLSLKDKTVNAYLSDGEYLKALGMTRSNQIWTAYPFAEGIVHDVTVHEVVEWMNGLEAQIDAGLDAASLAFFDTMYFKNKGKYEPGKSYKLSLSALAYHVVQSEPKIIKDKDGREWKTKGMAGFFPMEGGDIDDFSFTFPIKEIIEFNVFGKSFYRFRAPLFRIPEGDYTDVDIYLYAPKELLGSYTPAVGDDITGVLWLQGHLAE